MKKLWTFAASILLLFVLAACGPSEVELPHLGGNDKEAIREILEDEGLEVHFFVDQETDMENPHMFLRYFDHETGDIVHEGDTVTVVVSSDLIEEEPREPAPLTPIDPDGHFTGAGDIALYLDTFGELPGNFITLAEALDRGYDEDEANLWDVAEGKSIGGCEFDPEGYEGLPNGEERTYFIADVGYDGGERDEERIMYSDDGLVYYSPDGFETFEQFFGNEEHPPLEPDAHYTNEHDVALYYRTFGKLPPNYHDRDAWDGTLVDLREEYGQDAYFGYWHFSNWANQLPPGRTYNIADVNIAGAGHSRGNDRLVFSLGADRLVYYTPDHFETYGMFYGDGRD